MLAPSPIPSQIPHTLFDIISLSKDAVLCHTRTSNNCWLIRHFRTSKALLCKNCRIGSEKNHYLVSLNANNFKSSFDVTWCIPANQPTLAHDVIHSFFGEITPGSNFTLWSSWHNQSSMWSSTRISAWSITFNAVQWRWHRCSNRGHHAMYVPCSLVCQPVWMMLLLAIVRFQMPSMNMEQMRPWTWNRCARNSSFSIIADARYSHSQLWRIASERKNSCHWQ